MPNQKLVAVTFTFDTSAYASGDLLADSQVLTGVMPAGASRAYLDSVVLNDKDAQGVALFIVLMSASTSLGTENSAPNISDANLDACLGIIPVATTDYVTISGAKVATLRNLRLIIQPVTGTRNIYVGLLNSTGTPTFTATGMTGRFGFVGEV